MPQPPLSTGASASRPPDDVAVVLVHGYLCVWPGLYWYGLRPLRRSLLARGIPVLTSRQPRTASVELRAGQLASLLERLPHRRLVLVGHSMGGLDTRWVASRHDPQRRISPVVTVGPPHRGTRPAEGPPRRGGGAPRPPPARPPGPPARPRRPARPHARGRGPARRRHAGPPRRHLPLARRLPERPRPAPLLPPARRAAARRGRRQRRPGWRPLRGLGNEQRHRRGRPPGPDRRHRGARGLPPTRRRSPSARRPVPPRRPGGSQSRASSSGRRAAVGG